MTFSVDGSAESLVRIFREDFFLPEELINDAFFSAIIPVLHEWSRVERCRFFAWPYPPVKEVALQRKDDWRRKWILWGWTAIKELIRTNSWKWKCFHKHCTWEIVSVQACGKKSCQVWSECVAQNVFCTKPQVILNTKIDKSPHRSLHPRLAKTPHLWTIFRDQIWSLIQQMPGRIFRHSCLVEKKYKKCSRKADCYFWNDNMDLILKESTFWLDSRKWHWSANDNREDSDSKTGPAVNLELST